MGGDQSLFSHLDPRVGYVTQQGYRNLLSRQHGWIAIYGAFNENGTFTSPGNEAFDKEIRSRNPDLACVTCRAKSSARTHARLCIGATHPDACRQPLARLPPSHRIDTCDVDLK